LAEEFVEKALLQVPAGKAQRFWREEVLRDSALRDVLSLSRLTKRLNVLTP
jgi:hypothetical protein